MCYWLLREETITSEVRLSLSVSNFHCDVTDVLFIFPVYALDGIRAMIDKKMRDIDDKEGWNKSKGKEKAREKAPAMQLPSVFRPNNAPPASATSPPPPPYGPGSSQPGPPVVTRKPSSTFVRKRPMSAILPSPTRSEFPGGSSSSGSRQQYSPMRASNRHSSALSYESDNGQSWTMVDAPQRNSVGAQEAMPNGSLRFEEMQDQGRPQSTEISDSNASSAEELPMSSSGKLKPRAARRERDESKELEQFFREGPSVVPKASRVSSQRPATANLARPTGLGEFLQNPDSRIGKLEVRPANTRSRTDTSDLAEFFRSTSPVSTPPHRSSVAGSDASSLPQALQDGSDGSSRRASVMSSQSSSNHRPVSRLEARPAAVRTRGDNGLVEFLRAGPPESSLQTGRRVPSPLPGGLSSLGVTKHSTSLDFPGANPERRAPRPPPKPRRPSTAPSSPIAHTFGDAAFQYGSSVNSHDPSTPRREARSARIQSRNEALSSLTSFLNEEPSESPPPTNRIVSQPSLATRSGPSRMASHEVLRSTSPPRAPSSIGDAPVTPSRRKRWSVLDSVFRPGTAQERPSTAPGNALPSFGSADPDWTPRTSSRASVYTNGRLPSGTQAPELAPSFPPAEQARDLKSRSSTLSSRTEEPRNLNDVGSSSAFSRPEDYNPSPNAPLEYVKLARTKGSRMIKAVETKKRTYLAVLCGEAGERIELFTVIVAVLLML
jgi:hypothetical protein